MVKLPEGLAELGAKRDEEISTADDWQDQLRRTTNGGLYKSSITNVELIFKHDEHLSNLIQFDDFSGQLIKTHSDSVVGLEKGYLVDSDNAVIRSYLDRVYQVTFAQDIIMDALVTTAQLNKINPLKSRIEAQKWDGKPRAETYFIDYLGAANDHYTRMVTRKWLAGAVSRVYHPGCKFDIIPILEGGQGIGKSTSVRILAPEYFTDSMKNMGKNKDDYQVLIGSWIVEIAELSAMKKTDLEGMKNFTSAVSDRYRASYGRYSTDHPRKNVFIGTTNQTDYLKDSTGERRFYPIKCGVNRPIKNPLKPNEDDILQILAEVKTWVDAGEPLYFDEQTIQEAKVHQQEAQVIDPLKDAILDYVNMDVPTNWNELNNNTKRSYYQRYKNGDNMDDLGEWLDQKLDDQKEPMQITSSTEIMAVVFDKSVDRYLTGRTNSEAKKIKLIMDNEDDWQSSRKYINNRRQRVYIRKIDVVMMNQLNKRR